MLDQLAAEPAGLSTPTRLLIDIVVGGPESVAELERVLVMPPQDTGLGEPWEERDQPLRIELRRRWTSTDARSLTPASATTGAHLVAATILLRARSTGR